MGVKGSEYALVGQRLEPPAWVSALGLLHLCSFGLFIYMKTPALPQLPWELTGFPTTRPLYMQSAAQDLGLWGRGRWDHDDSGHFPGAVKGDCSFVFQVRGAQEVLGDPWVAWEAVEETEAAFPHEGPGVPEETHPEEETSNTELETGSAPIRTCCSGPTDSLLVTSPHTLPCSHSEEKWCVLCPENLYDD